MMPQNRGIAKAAKARQFVHGQILGLQQFPSTINAHADEPTHRRLAHGLDEAPVKRPLADRRHVRHFSDGKRVIELGANIGDDV